MREPLLAARGRLWLLEPRHGRGRVRLGDEGGRRRAGGRDGGASRSPRSAVQGWSTMWCVRRSMREAADRDTQSRWLLHRRLALAGGQVCATGGCQQRGGSSDQDLDHLVILADRLADGRREGRRLRQQPTLDECVPRLMGQHAARRKKTKSSRVQHDLKDKINKK